MKIAILSDTHGLLREQVIALLEGCDTIFHAGDVGGEELLQKLRSIAPTIVVRGNNDKGEWGESLPKFAEGELEGIRYFMVHDKKDIPKDLKDIDVVIYGHSHKYFEEQREGIHFINPGSCGRKRFSLPLTMIVAQWENGEMSFTKVDIT